jgi:hypothetical protein
MSAATHPKQQHGAGKVFVFHVGSARTAKKNFVHETMYITRGTPCLNVQIPINLLQYILH